MRASYRRRFCVLSLPRLRTAARLVAASSCVGGRPDCTAAATGLVWPGSAAGARLIRADVLCCGRGLLSPSGAPAPPAGRGRALIRVRLTALRLTALRLTALRTADVG